MADIKKIGLFAGGVLFGSAGIKALSRMLKRYTHREQQLCSVLKIA